MDCIIKKRVTKNVITIALIVALGVGMLFTTGLVGGKHSDQPPMMGNQQMQQDQNNQNGDSDGQPPAPPSGDQSNDQNNQNGDSNGQPPAPPSGDQSNDQNNQNGDQSNGQSNQNNQGGPGAPPDMKGQPGKGGISTGMKIFTGAEALAIALLIVYLIMSGFNSKSIKETLLGRKQIAILAVATILAGGGLTAAGILIPSAVHGQHGPDGQNGQPQTEQISASDQNGQNNQGDQNGQGGPGGQNTQQVDATGATTVDGKEKTLNDSYESTTADENTILVTNGGSLTSDGATITKKSGDGSNTDSCDFHGVNAGILVNEDSSATIKNATIKTAANRSNAVFATGEKSKIEISDSTIETTGESSCRGLDATNGGTIVADKMKITTQGGSCATLATDRGEGTVTVTNSELETNGAGSPIIYSTGDISIDNTTGTSNGSQIAVVEGKNKATITNSTVTASATGNRGDVDVCGVMLYQSMSGDADEGTSEFKATGSTLTIDKDSKYYKTAPMFFVTNTDSVIRLTDTKLTFGSGTLLSVKGTSEWGNEGSNGGTVKVIAANQNLTGDVEVDKISEASIYLTKGSSYKGTINGDNTAKSVTLKISKNSKLTLTGDTYVTALDDKDTDYSNIDFNGYKLYVNGKAIN